MAERNNRQKQQRETEATRSDFMLKARIIMQADPFKERAPREEERAFCALFGCLCHVAYLLWKQLNAHGLLPQGGTMTHLLWTLAFLKVYPSEESLKSLFGGADIKTIRKRVDQFMTSVALLEPFVIKWENRKKDDVGNDCLVSVDGTDFRIPIAGRRFYSYKYRASGLRYEVAVCILTG